MKYLTPAAILLGALCGYAVPSAFAQSGAHVVVAPSDLKWAAVPALPPGAQMAVIEGPLSEAVPFTARAKLPANYKIPPHWHPAIEHVTVLSGTLNLGMGDTFDMNKTQALTAGNIAITPPKTNHFVWTSEETILQIHGVGPWGITYVNSADDPRQTTGAR